MVIKKFGNALSKALDWLILGSTNEPCPDGYRHTCLTLKGWNL